MEPKTAGLPSAAATLQFPAAYRARLFPCLLYWPGSPCSLRISQLCSRKGTTPSLTRATSMINKPLRPQHAPKRGGTNYSWESLREINKTGDVKAACNGSVHQSFRAAGHLRGCRTCTRGVCSQLVSPPGASQDISGRKIGGYNPIAHHPSAASDTALQQCDMHEQHQS